ncbi:MAG TPA: hypothetical protein VLA89_04535, partial [Gemmatimonadales bacterium]|nr:hypothetical protein [Gemmatimonadales bacterium]
MTREIKIVGELVQIIESTVVSEGTLEATLPFLETRIPVISPILPDNNVRAATYDDSGDTKMYEILVQLPPLVRKLEFD